MRFFRTTKKTLTFDGQVFGEQCLSAPDDALVDDGGKLEQLLAADLLFGIGCRAVTASNDRYLEAFSELGCRAENSAVDEVNEREVLEQVILNGRARQEDALAGLQLIQRVVGLI